MWALTVGLTVTGPATPTPTSSPSTGADVVGLSEYLGQSEYLRGVNVYTLVMQRGAGPGETRGEPPESYEFLASRGFDTVRLAVPWQQLQRIPRGGDARDGLDAPIDRDYLDLVRDEVAKAGEAGLRTIIDLHNGCTYPWGPGPLVRGSLRCGDGIWRRDVARIWTVLSDTFRDDPRVAAYNIFNEPRMSVGIETYKEYAQATVDAIRANGDTHAIWVDSILSRTAGRFAAMAPEGPGTRPAKNPMTLPRAIAGTARPISLRVG